MQRSGEIEDVKKKIHALGWDRQLCLEGALAALA